MDEGHGQEEKQAEEGEMRERPTRYRSEGSPSVRVQKMVAEEQPQRPMLVHARPLAADETSLA